MSWLVGQLVPVLSLGAQEGAEQRGPGPVRSSRPRAGEIETVPPALLAQTGQACPEARCPCGLSQEDTTWLGDLGSLLPTFHVTFLGLSWVICTQRKLDAVRDS